MTSPVLVGAAHLSSPLRVGLAILAATTLASGIAQSGDKPLYVIVALAAGAAFALVVDADRPAPVLRSPLVIWVYLFLLATLAWGLWRTAVTPLTDQAIVDRFRSMALLLAMAVVFDDERARTIGGRALVLVAVVTSLVNVAEAIGLVTFPEAPGRVPGRAAGLFVNANGAGFAIVFPLAAGLGWTPRSWRAPALLVGACGVAVTFSRGALACLALVAAIALWQRALPRRHVALVGVLGAAAAALAGGTLENLLETAGVFTENNLARLAMTADDSGRGALAGRAWAHFLEAPWLGHGVGIDRAGRVAHNMYLYLAVEHGALGLIAFPAFILALWTGHRAALATAVALFVAGFTAHNLLDKEPVLICCALAAARPHAPAAARSSNRAVAVTSASTE